MAINQVTIPQIGTASYAPGSDGTPGSFQSGSTPVPNQAKADGKLGTGSNATYISGSTPVPHSNKADGLDGSWSSVPFQGGLPAGGTPIPHPGAADDH